MKLRKIIALVFVLMTVCLTAVSAENEWGTDWGTYDGTGFDDNWSAGDLGDASIPMYILCALAGLTGGGAVMVHKKRKNGR